MPPDGNATSTPEHDLSGLPAFPMWRTSPFAEPAGYTRLRAAGAMVRTSLPNGAPVWAVTRYAEARQILGDPRISSDTGRPERPRASDDDRPDEGFFVEVDPPEHTKYRRPLIAEFGARPIAELRPRIQEIVDDALAGLLAAGPPADLAAVFARPVTARVVCALLGVPVGDREFVESRLGMLSVMTINPPHAVAASREVRGYLRELIGRAQEEPIEGLVGRMAPKHVATGELTADELINMCFLLLLAGYEAPANMISLGALTLLEHPEQLAALRADQDLLPGTVDELMRFYTLQDWVSLDRVALADIDIAGVRIRAGDRLTVLALSANRDDRVFENPDRFDIRRPARHHLAFGYGIHQCLGQNLARAELEIAYRTLFTRLPALRLAATVDELEFAYDAPFFGPHALPVAW